MGLFNNKKGVDWMYSTVVFIILNLVFFGILLAFVVHSGTNAGIYEKKYAREVALLIDSSEPGTIISLNLEEIKKFSEDNGIKLEDIFSIKDNKISVKLIKGAGNSYEYFSNYDIEPSVNVDKDNVYLYLLIKEKTT